MFRRPAPDASPTPAGDPALKPRRWGLYGPYIALAIAAALWTGAWMAARHEVIRRMDDLVVRLDSTGHHLSWTRRSVSGYPFRLDLVLTDFRSLSPSGWGIKSRQVEAEAFMHAPDHWVLVAPDGITLVRPMDGPVDITGSPIRASLRGLSVTPPSFSLEGVNLRFTAKDRTRPFLLSAADRVEFHLRPGPDHQGAVLFRLSNGQATLPGLLGRIADNQPVNLELEAILSKADALRGPGWATAIRAWSQAGGKADLKSAKIAAGPALIAARPGTLNLTPDGRLAGQLDVDLRKAPETLSDLGAKGVIPEDPAVASDLSAQAKLSFRDGAAYLGALPIGPAPKLF